MHALATSYEAVAADEEHATLNGEAKPLRSRFADYLPSSSNVFGGLRLGGERSRLHSFTTIMFGWPMPPHDPARETAWLDGLRGTAAFLVMSYHFNVNWFNPALVEEPWGAHMDKYAWDVWRMPFFRLFMCSGHTQVSIFFVLSGFVLSWSPLSSIRAANYDKLYKGLGSSAFRRWIRLYLPTIPVALWECIELYLGYRQVGTKPRESNIFLQLWDFVKSSEQYSNPFNVNRNQFNSLHAYDYTMWTIPYEFAGSLLVFFILLCVGRIRHYGRRTLAIGCIVVYAALRAEWSFWLFSNGILIADYVKEHGGFTKLSEKQTRPSLILWSVVMVCALWLGGLPAAYVSEYTRPGYDWLDYITPGPWADAEGGGRIWWNIAGIGIVFSACHLTTVRRIFEFSFFRYLGRISYMLYLTHRVVLEPALKPYKEWVIQAFGREKYIDTPPNNGSPYHWLISITLWLCLWAVIGPCAILTAHWCERLFDAPSVKFARWIDDKCMKGFTKRVDSQADDAPTLPTHSAAPAPVRANGSLARYRDDEPALNGSANGKADGMHDKEAVELVELPPRPEVASELVMESPPTGPPPSRLV